MWVPERVRGQLIKIHRKHRNYTCNNTHSQWERRVRWLFARGTPTQEAQRYNPGSRASIVAISATAWPAQACGKARYRRSVIARETKARGVLFAAVTVELIYEMRTCFAGDELTDAPLSTWVRVDGLKGGISLKSIIYMAFAGWRVDAHWLISGCAESFLFLSVFAWYYTKFDVLKLLLEVFFW